ncbi:MAG: hypothetical protein L0H39_08735, partial [Brachybacterium sp.]|nr:hypothetical protein [Brachybacterium sp.]
MDTDIEGAVRAGM